MKLLASAGVLIPILLLAAVPVTPAEHARLGEPDQAAQDEVQEAYGRLPLSFEANQGQADGQVKFLSRGGGYSVFLTATEAVMTLRRLAPAATGERRDKQGTMGTQLRIEFLGANPQPAVGGLDELPGKLNYFVGNDPNRWRTNIPTFAKVRYHNVYPGVDLVYYGNQRQLAYDFFVGPGADPRAIRVSFKGADKLSLNDKGDLVLQAGGGEVIQYAPIAYQEINGLRREISSRYVLQGKNQVGFQVAAYDPSKPLVIDPTLSYSTYLSGDSFDRGFGIAVDSSGNAYITGDTASIDFPTAKPLQRAYGGSLADVFVAKLNPTGSTLIYSTFLGGSGIDQGTAIAVDLSNHAYVTGITDSTDFPAARPFQPARSGFNDAFVAKLNAKGSALVYSTYLGGSSSEKAFGIATDASENAYVTGFTSSADFPTASPLQPAFGGFADAFVTKLNPTGSVLIYSTYLGGSDLDVPTAIAAGGSGSSYVTGITQSANFPTANPLQRAFRGDIDAFVAKLNPAGSQLVYSTYLGGKNDDRGLGIAVDSSGNAYATGFTASPNFPTENALNDFAGVFDAFVAKLNSAGSRLVYSTFLGGNSVDSGLGITVDVFGNAYVTGSTQSIDFPTKRAVQPDFGGDVDAFIAKLNPTGSALVYSTYLGGRDSDAGNSIAVDTTGNAYITGNTLSANFPTSPGPLDTICGTDGLCNGGFGDAFVVKIVGD